MTTTKTNTAILIFSHSAERELLNKSFTENLQLFEVLNRDTLVKVKRSGLTYFHYTEKEQIGHSFGERFVNAIQEVFEKGFDNVITIGNDSPQLKTEHLLTAATQLQQGKTVLGPTFDGGFYLMGLHRSNFDAKVFLRLPWQRFGLFRRISQLLKNKNVHVHQLPSLHDIDSTKDVIFVINHIRSLSLSLLKVLQGILKYDILRPIYRQTDYTFLYQRLVFNKGSPSLLSF